MIVEGFIKSKQWKIGSTSGMHHQFAIGSIYLKHHYICRDAKSVNDMVADAKLTVDGEFMEGMLIVPFVVCFSNDNKPL